MANKPLVVVAGNPTATALVAGDIGGLTAGSVPFSDGTGLAQDNTNFFWDAVNLRLGVGVNTPGSAVDVLSTNGRNTISGSGVFGGQRASNNAGTGPSFTLGRVRGTAILSPAVVVAGDTLGSVIFLGYDGVSTFRNSAQLSGVVTETTPSPTAMGGDLVVLTSPPGTIIPTETARFTSSKRVSVKGAYADQSYSLQVPLTGFSITPGNSVETLLLEPAAALAAGTITMPAAPIDGQRFQFVITQNVLALVVQANTGQTMKGGVAASYVAFQTFGWTYVASNTSWYLTHG